MLEIEKKYSLAETEEKVQAVVGWLEEKQGADILALDLHELSAFSEAMVIVTATSRRHAKGLADFVRTEAKTARYELFNTEGKESDWILVDMNDVIVHVFQRETRAFFNLEGLWSQAKILADLRETRTADEE